MFSSYTEDAIIEIYEMALMNCRYSKYLPEVRKEIRRRLSTHEKLVKDFAPYGVIKEMTLTKQDFIQSC